MLKILLITSFIFISCKAQNNLHLKKNENIKSQKIVISADSIKKELYKGEKGKLFCTLLSNMHRSDQKYRKLIDPSRKIFIKTLDSIYNSIGMSLFTDGSGRPVAAKMTKEEQIPYGNQARRIVDKKYPQYSRENLKKRRDSLWKIQIPIDNYNTELLIDIIEKRGYPNEKNCKCTTKILKSLIIFRHSQQKYFNRIKFLIKREYDNGNLDEGKYKLFLNHINGRKSYDTK